MMFFQNIVCFMLGAVCLYAGTRIRQKIDNSESIKIPSISETIEKKKVEKRERDERNETQQILDNINNYPYNQKEIR